VWSSGSLTCIGILVSGGKILKGLGVLGGGVEREMDGWLGGRCLL